MSSDSASAGGAELVDASFKQRDEILLQLLIPVEKGNCLVHARLQLIKGLLIDPCSERWSVQRESHTLCKCAATAALLRRKASMRPRACGSRCNTRA